MLRNRRLCRRQLLLRRKLLRFGKLLQRVDLHGAHLYGLRVGRQYVRHLREGLPDEPNVHQRRLRRHAVAGRDGLPVGGGLVLWWQLLHGRDQLLWRGRLVYRGQYDGLLRSQRGRLQELRRRQSLHR
jgi:hypothetical protein